MTARAVSGLESPRVPAGAFIKMLRDDDKGKPAEFGETTSSNHCLTVSGKNFIARKGKRFVREHGDMLRGA
jgi:hypothetical protein